MKKNISKMFVFLLVFAFILAGCDSGGAIDSAARGAGGGSENIGPGSCTCSDGECDCGTECNCGDGECDCNCGTEACDCGCDCGKTAEECTCCDCGKNPCDCVDTDGDNKCDCCDGDKAHECSFNNDGKCKCGKCNHGTKDCGCKECEECTCHEWFDHTGPDPLPPCDDEDCPWTNDDDSINIDVSENQSSDGSDRPNLQDVGDALANDKDVEFVVSINWNNSWGSTGKDFFLGKDKVFNVANVGNGTKTIKVTLSDKLKEILLTSEVNAGITIINSDGKISEPDSNGNYLVTSNGFNVYITKK